MKELTGKTALVTGASSGIGEALAHELGTEVAPADPDGLSTAFHDRSDAGQTSELGRGGPTIALRTYNGQ